MKVKRIISVLLVLSFLSVFIGYKLYNKPHINVAEEATDITLTASMLFIDFSKDEIKANAKYLDKIIAVKGVVTNIADKDKKRAITLQTSDDFGSVICYFAEDESMNRVVIKEGQAIFLKGICTGFLMDVILVKCVIINSK